MSRTSRWPLPSDGIRFVAPDFVKNMLAKHSLTAECYPVAVGYYPKAQGHRMRRLVHDDHLLIYCVEGTGELKTKNYDGAVGAGDLVVLPRGEKHAYHADKEDPWSIYWCHFDGSVSDDFVDAIAEASSYFVQQVGHSSSALAGFKSMLSVRQTGYSTTALVHAANQLRQLLTLLPLEIQTHGAPHHHGLNVDKIQSLMWDNLSDQLSLELLAENANLSKFHFSAKYKKLTGYSPIKHFIHMKMEHACFLLDTTDLSVGDIAAELGYDDALYFSRLFKKTLGMSPKVYRLSH